jgi:heterodisulfide reductase subunit A
MLKEQIPEAEITIYHPEPLVMDNGLDEFYQEAQNKFGVKYLKARIKEVVEKPPHNLLLRAVNAESGRMVEDEADMVVLSTGLVPAVSDDLALMLSLQRGVGSFFESTNPETDTVTTNVEGVFLAGVAEGPKSIMASVQQAHAAAFKASGVLKKLEAEASSSIRVSNKGGDKSG